MPAIAEVIQPNTKRAYLTFLEELPRYKKNGITYRMCLVKCDCGNIKQMQLHQFRNDKVYSCGCKMAIRKFKNPFFEVIESRDKKIERDLAERRQLVNTTDLNELINLETTAIEGKCTVSYLLHKTRAFLTLKYT